MYLFFEYYTYTHTELILLTSPPCAWLCYEQSTRGHIPEENCLSLHH